MMVGKGGITIMKAKQNPSEKIGIAKFWGWQARAISMGSMVIILGYLQIYCTDTLGLNAAIVGTIMLVSKIVDAFTDLVAGLIIDNTHTKLGKARPYELALFPLWICTWLLFSCPEGFGTTAKYIWVFFMYVFVNSIFATALYSNQTAYMLRAFDTNEKIVKVNSYGSIVVTLGCAEYNVLCGRKRMETSLRALSSFATKVGQGLGSVVIGSILTAFGYDGTAVAQSASAILGIKLCFSFIPAAAYLLIAILCMVYKLDGVLAKKRAEAAAKAKAEA